jgi:hypothetical protein
MIPPSSFIASVNNHAGLLNGRILGEEIVEVCFMFPRHQGKEPNKNLLVGA